MIQAGVQTLSRLLIGVLSQHGFKVESMETQQRLSENHGKSIFQGKIDGSPTKTLRKSRKTRVQGKINGTQQRLSENHGKSRIKQPFLFGKIDGNPRSIKAHRERKVLALRLGVPHGELRCNGTPMAGPNIHVGLRKLFFWCDKAGLLRKVRNQKVPKTKGEKGGSRASFLRIPF